MKRLISVFLVTHLDYPAGSSAKLRVQPQNCVHRRIADQLGRGSWPTSATTNDNKQYCVCKKKNRIKAILRRKAPLGSRPTRRVCVWGAAIFFSIRGRSVTQLWAFRCDDLHLVRNVFVSFSFWPWRRKMNRSALSLAFQFGWNTPTWIADGRRPAWRRVLLGF